MTIYEADTLVHNYFRRLDELLGDVTDDRREQLVGELRDHVTQARSETDLASVAAVQEILERIGSPEEIAAAEHDEGGKSTRLLAYLSRRRATFADATSMTARRWELLGAFAGLGFVLAYLVAMLLPPSAPNVAADVDTMTNYLNLNVHPLVASGVIGTGAALILLVFLGSLHHLMERSDHEGGMPASIVLATGIVFAAVAALSGVFTSTLAILAGQSVGNLSSAPYVPWAYLLRTILGTGVLELAGGVFAASLGIALVTRKLARPWFGLISVAIAACAAAGGGSALVLGSYSQLWMVIQTVGLYGIAFVLVGASAAVLFHAIRVPARQPETKTSPIREHNVGFWPVRRVTARPRLSAALLLSAFALAAAIAGPLLTRATNQDLLSANSIAGSGASSPGTANVANANSSCAPTTDAATSGGPASTLTGSANKVASGTVDGQRWSLWSEKGQSGATGLEDGGVVVDGRSYGLCPGYPNPAELEMIDTGSHALVYGVIGYPGRATVDLSVGTVGSFSTGQALPSPKVYVVDGVSFFIGALPNPACSYSAFELNSTSPGVSAEHNLGFGGAGEGTGYPNPDNAGNTGSCVKNEIDPISFSQGIWQLPPGQFTDNFR